MHLPWHECLKNLQFMPLSIFSF
jgi:hypothetical protein